MHRPSLSAAALVGVLLLATARPARAVDAPPHRLSIVLSAGLDGAFAPAVCREGEPVGRTLAHLAASVAKAREEAEADDRTVLAAIQLGDFSGPAALGRFLLARPDGPARFAELVGQLGFTHAIVGNNWLAQEAAVLAKLAVELPRRGIRIVSAGISCEGRADCAALAALPSRVRIDTDDLSITFIGSTSEAILPTIDPAERAGLGIDPLAQVLQKQASAARADGTDLVIAATHVQANVNGLGPLGRVLRDLEDVDLLLANELADLTEASATLRPAIGPALAVSGLTPTSAVRLDFDVEQRAGRMRIPWLKTTRVMALEPEPALRAALITLTKEYCAELDRPLAATLTRAVSPREFTAFVLDELRRAAQAEVGLVNDGLVDDAAFPFEGAMSTADVFAALPYEDTVVRAELSGARLRAIWKLQQGRQALLRRHLAWVGINEREGTIYVNERPLDDSSRYLVVLPDFVARGGDELVGDPIAFELVPGPDGKSLTVRDVVLTALQSPDAGPAVTGDRPLDLARRPRWSWSAALTLAANDTRLRNDPTYPDARLQRQRASALKGEGTGRVDADALDHSLRLSGRARYARTSVGAEPSAETEDQLYAETLYRLKILRRMLDEAGIAPVPYVSASLDSEFLPNPLATYRRMEAGVNVGLRFVPIRPLEIKLGAGVRRELLDPEGRTRLGLELGYELPRFSPLKLRGLPVDVESGVDYFVSDFQGAAIHEGRLRARVLLPLGGPLSFAVGVDVLALKQNGAAYALLSEATFGITARFDGARQQF